MVAGTVIERLSGGKGGHVSGTPPGQHLQHVGKRGIVAGALLILLGPSQTGAYLQQLDGDDRPRPGDSTSLGWAKARSISASSRSTSAPVGAPSGHPADPAVGKGTPSGWGGSGTRPAGKGDGYGMAAMVGSLNAVGGHG